MSSVPSAFVGAPSGHGYRRRRAAPARPRKLGRQRYDRYRRIGQYTNFLRATVGHDVTQIGGDIARLTRRTRHAQPAASATGEDAEGLLVP